MEIFEAFVSHVKTVLISIFLEDKNVSKILDYQFSPMDIQGMNVYILSF